MNKRETHYFKSDKEWRAWLLQNHNTSTGVYLILYRVNSGISSMRWEEAVRVALCFGWIDSTSKRMDDQKRQQLFTPRKTKSVWSKLNKTHIEDLNKKGLMHVSGLNKIEAAKTDGSWEALDQVENLTIPEDLLLAFKNNAVAYQNYQKFSPSYRKSYLYWLNSAKRTYTREIRISEIIRLCEENIKMRS